MFWDSSKVVHFIFLGCAVVHHWVASSVLIELTCGLRWLSFGQLLFIIGFSPLRWGNQLFHTWLYRTLWLLELWVASIRAWINALNDSLRLFDHEFFYLALVWESAHVLLVIYVCALMELRISPLLIYSLNLRASIKLLLRLLLGLRLLHLPLLLQLLHFGKLHVWMVHQ